MTALRPLTPFDLVAELRAKIRTLESSGAVLANSEERWKLRALEAEAERDELAAQKIARELSDEEGPTVVDQTAELRRLRGELDYYQNSLAGALRSALTGRRLLDAACEAIRAAKKAGAWPRRYMP